MKLSKEIIDFLCLRIEDKKYFLLDANDLMITSLKSIEYEKDNVTIKSKSICKFYYSWIFIEKMYQLDFNFLIQEVYLFFNKGFLEFCENLKHLDTLNTKIANKIISKIKYDDKNNITYESYKEAYDELLENKTKIRRLGFALHAMNNRIDYLLKNEKE